MEVNIWSTLDESRAQIRLMALLPHADWQAPISCRLSTVSLNSTLEYEAVSYVWGTAKHESPITLHGRTHYINENMESCLRHFRCETTERMLWVDSICINQASNAEKSSQVALMRQIYKAAQRVCVWLGEGSAEVTRAFRVLRAIEQSVRLADVVVEGSKLTVKDFECLPITMQSEWWTRVWVVQEVCQFNDVHLFCGEESIELAVLENFLIVWDRLLFERSEETALFLYHGDRRLSSTFSCTWVVPLQSLLDVRKMYARIQSGTAGYDQVFLHILATCRDKRATRLPDKVYGLLAMSPEDFGSSFRADFDLSAEQAYIQFAISYLEYTQSLSLLNQCSRQQNSLTSLPSWVPDWSANHPSFEYNALRLDGQVRYKACGDSTLVFEVLNDSLLCLQGIFIDTICTKGDLAVRYAHLQGTFEDRWEGYTGVFKQWQDMICANKHDRRRYVAGDHIFNAYWKLLFGDVMFPEIEHDPGGNIRRCKRTDSMAYRAWQKALDTGRVAYTAAEASVSAATTYRRMFRCRKGYIGLGPPGIAVGDHIYVVAGGRVPLVLRAVEQAAQPNTFQLVGECHVHGIMDGEAVAASSSTRKRERLRDSLYRKAFGGDGADLELGQRGFEKIYLV